MNAITQRATSQAPINATQPLDEQIRRLSRLIDQPPMTSRVLEIGPQLAEHILETRNTSNRPMKAGKVREYAQALKSGQWGLTGDTLKFSPDGTLRDGQNRLAAVVRSKVPMRTHAVFGVEPELFPRMDIGKNRTPADVFHIAGFQYANHAAATVRWLLILLSANPKNRAAHFTNEELLDAYRNRFEPDTVEESVRVALEVKKGTGAPVAAMAALHYIFAQQDRERADAFFREWAEGRKRSVTTKLQERLTALMLQTNRRVHEVVRNALVVRAWHAYNGGPAFEGEALEFDPVKDEFPPLSVEQKEEEPV